MEVNDMEMLHGTLHITVDCDISDVYRVWLSQKGTHYGELYYPDYTDEEIQKIQDLEQAQLDKAYEFGRQSAQPENKKLLAWQEDFQGYIKMLNLPRDDYKGIMEYINEVPSAQPERTCVNCGRTANNGGWYADGGTRCPIEEHYALPKDGYCHLWEKRNITDDDYPERKDDE